MPVARTRREAQGRCVWCELRAWARRWLAPSAAASPSPTPGRCVLALQVPDELLPLAGRLHDAVHAWLSSPETRPQGAEEEVLELPILSDSTFAPCCVDWRSAVAHGGARGILHFGPACWSEVRTRGRGRLWAQAPVFYVVGRDAWDLARGPPASVGEGGCSACTAASLPAQELLPGELREHGVEALAAALLPQLAASPASATAEQPTAVVHVKCHSGWVHVAEALERHLAGARPDVRVVRDPVVREYVPDRAAAVQAAPVDAACARTDCCSSSKAGEVPAPDACSREGAPACHPEACQPLSPGAEALSDIPASTPQHILYMGAAEDAVLDTIVLANALPVWSLDPAAPSPGGKAPVLQGPFPRNRRLIRRLGVAEALKAASVVGVLLGANDGAFFLSSSSACSPPPWQEGCAE
jgi:hypothetical protein